MLYWKHVNTLLLSTAKVVYAVSCGEAVTRRRSWGDPKSLHALLHGFRTWNYIQNVWYSSGSSRLSTIDCDCWCLSACWGRLQPPVTLQRMVRCPHMSLCVFYQLKETVWRGPRPWRKKHKDNGTERNSMKRTRLSWGNMKPSNISYVS